MMSDRDEMAELQRRRRSRNWALLVALVGFAALVYVVSIVRMSGN
jgi:hypothetical protein